MYEVWIQRIESKLDKDKLDLYMYLEYSFHFVHFFNPSKSIYK